jgi:hypothetical protein
MVYNSPDEKKKPKNTTDKTDEKPHLTTLPDPLPPEKDNYKSDHKK